VISMAIAAVAVKIANVNNVILVKFLSILNMIPYLVVF
jgi:hypothetical protein